MPGIIFLSFHMSKFSHVLAFQICSSLLLPVMAREGFHPNASAASCFQRTLHCLQQVSFYVFEWKRAMFLIVLLTEQVGVYWHMLVGSVYILLPSGC